jgi:hypothetical protein
VLIYQLSFLTDDIILFSIGDFYNVTGHHKTFSWCPGSDISMIMVAMVRVLSREEPRVGRFASSAAYCRVNNPRARTFGISGLPVPLY